MFSSIYDISIAIIQVLQNIGDWFIVIMKFFSALGVEEFYLLIMPVLIWTIDYNFGLRLGVLLLLNTGFNSILKMAFHEPRPFWVSSEVKSMNYSTSGFGIPSGHSMTPMSIFGLIAATVKRSWVTVVMALVIFFIGLSRLALGVHFLQDVLVGWAFGLLFLWLFLRYEKPVSTWLGKQSMGQKIGVVVAVSIGMLLIGVGIIAASRGFEIPEAWQANIALFQPDNPVEPFTMDGVITSAGALLGLAIGAFWIQDQGGISDEGNAWQRIARFVIGLVGVLLIWRGLKAVFPGGENLLAYTFRYIRYILTGLWISGIAPMVFMKLKLAKQKE